MKSYLVQNVNTMIGTALLASVALAAIMIIVDVEAEANEEFIHLTIEHRLYKAVAQTGMTEEELSAEIQ